MKSNKLKAIILIIFCIALIGLHLNSATWFRLKLADYYRQTQNYEKAILIYKQALRKTSLKTGPRVSGFTGISKASAITSLLKETYFKGVEYHLGRAEYYFKPDISGLKLFDKTMAEYEKIDKLRGDYIKTFPSVSEETDSGWGRIIKESENRKIDDCFALGEQYIKKRMWEEAKNFYTRTILKYLNPVIVLEKLDVLYKIDKDREIRDRIWGGGIYVDLEDFEGLTKPAFYRWAGNTKPAVNIHRISNEVSHTGKSSECFGLSYTKKGYDYWVKPVKIPLSDSGLALGVRIYIKNKGPFKGLLRVNISYPKQSASGVTQSGFEKDAGQEWERQRIDNLFEKAKAIALQRNWDMSGMEIDRVIIDTAGVSGQFYIDDVELYVIDNEVSYAR